MLIPRQIDENEILVRFIFETDFKNKIILHDKLNKGNLFFDSRGGVSLQRYSFCNEDKCKFFAYKVPNRNFIGFAIFRKWDFTNQVTVQNQLYPTFKAQIKSSPLDTSMREIPEEIEVTTETQGNPSHADIIYIVPEHVNNETPNTIIRLFSKLLSERTKVIIDTNTDQLEFIGQRFKTLFY